MNSLELQHLDAIAGTEQVEYSKFNNFAGFAGSCAIVTIDFTKSFTQWMASNYTIKWRKHKDLGYGYYFYDNSDGIKYYDEFDSKTCPFYSLDELIKEYLKTL